jgi:hypothetical protein
MSADYSVELLRTLREQVPAAYRGYVPDEYRLRRYLPAALIVAGLGALAYVVIDATSRRREPEPREDERGRRRR